ncbi:MAG: biopolymer transporter ExbD [Terrimicrobiaceae bacterium]|nr:biopolymer transporter ExbD [Terrimicrobiaceae bacterium]
MKLVRSPRLHPALMFVVPGLDVVLTLAFFLVLSTSFLLQPGVAVTVPQSPFLLAPQRDPRVVGITAPPAAGIFFEDRKVTPEELREILSEATGSKHTLIIKADRLAAYENVAEVLTIALELGYPAVLATSEKP